jgi:hypothetical protein
MGLSVIDVEPLAKGLPVIDVEPLVKIEQQAVLAQPTAMHTVVQRVVVNSDMHGYQKLHRQQLVALVGVAALHVLAELGNLQQVPAVNQCLAESLIFLLQYEIMLRQEEEVEEEAVLPQTNFQAV